MQKYYLMPADIIESNFPEDDLSVFEVFYKDKTGNDSIYELMGQYLSSDESNYDSIITALQKELVSFPNSLLDQVEYDNDGEPEFIEVWEKVENRFSVKEFCDLVGIKSK